MAASHVAQMADVTAVTAFMGKSAMNAISIPISSSSGRRINGGTSAVVIQPWLRPEAVLDFGQRGDRNADEGEVRRKDVMAVEVIAEYPEARQPQRRNQRSCGKAGEHVRIGRVRAEERSHCFSRYSGMSRSMA